MLLLLLSGPLPYVRHNITGARCSFVVRAFAHCVIGHGGPIGLFLNLASTPKLVCVMLSVG